MAKNSRKRSGAEVFGAIIMVIVMIAAVGYAVWRESRLNHLYEILLSQAGEETNPVMKILPSLSGVPEEETFSLTSVMFFLDEERRVVDAFEAGHAYEVVIHLSNQSTKKLKNVQLTLDGMVGSTELNTREQKYPLHYTVKAFDKTTEVISQTESKLVDIFGANEVRISYEPASANYRYSTTTDASNSLKDEELLISEIGAALGSLSIDGVVEVHFRVIVESLDDDVVEPNPDGAKNPSEDDGATRIALIAFTVGVLSATVFITAFYVCTLRKSKS